MTPPTCTACWALSTSHRECEILEQLRPEALERQPQEDIEVSADCSREFLDLASCKGIEATDDVRGRVVMLAFCRKGVAVLLTYAEVLALGRVLRRLVQATASERSP